MLLILRHLRYKLHSTFGAKRNAVNAAVFPHYRALKQVLGAPKLLPAVHELHQAHRQRVHVHLRIESGGHSSAPFRSQLARSVVARGYAAEVLAISAEQAERAA